MKKHRILFSLAPILLLPSCFGKKPVRVISDLAYGKRSSAEPVVYIPEGDQYVPFLVLTDDYGGNTLLLRRDVLAGPRRINEYRSFYEDSEMDAYLNSEYLPALSEIGALIQPSELTITDGSAIGFSGDETKTIERSLFLLSCEEVRLGQSVNAGREGEALEYFTPAENRVAYSDGAPSSWWLRTPNTYYLSCTYVVGSNNKLGSTNAFDENRVRPAFCVLSSSKIERSAEIVPEQTVYIFSQTN